MTILFAASRIDHEFLRGFRPEAVEGGSPFWSVLPAVVIIAVAAWVVTLLFQRDRRRHGPASRRLARRLGLGFAQRRLLERVARLAGMTQAGSILISRGCYDFAASRYIARHGDADQLRVIRRHVFDL